MATVNLNRVVLTGNLTRDPELRATAGGTSLCSLHVARTTRRKNPSTGECEPKAKYFDVTVWGAQGENCARFLTNGRPVAVDGRPDWREWETTDGDRRTAVDIVTDAVQFLAGNRDAGGHDDGHVSSGQDPDANPTTATLGSELASDIDIPF